MSDQWAVGDIYEDCSYHPVLLTEIESYDHTDEQTLMGISLIDGSGPRSCSTRHCGPRKLSMEEAVELKKNWPLIQAEIDEKMKDYWQ